VSVSVVDFRQTYSTKTAGTTIPLVGTTGADSPQVGDVVVWGWSADNLTASTPTMSLVGGAGFGPISYLTSNSPQSAAAGGTVRGLAWAQVTSVPITWPTITLSGSVAVKVAGVIALRGALLPVAASAGSTGSPTASLQAVPTDGAQVLLFSSETSTALGAPSGWTSQVPLATSGGSAATNVAMTLSTRLSGAAGTASTTVTDGGWVYLSLSPAPVALAAEAWNGTAWVKNIEGWNGSQWRTDCEVWNGTEWVPM
jgi:hypothetical protein